MIAVKQGAVPERPTRGRPRKYPLDRMSVGDYFDVEETPAGNQYQVLHACIRHYRLSQCGETERCVEFQIDRQAQGRKIMLRVTRTK